MKTTRPGDDVIRNAMTLMTVNPDAVAVGGCIEHQVTNHHHVSASLISRMK